MPRIKVTAEKNLVITIPFIIIASVKFLELWEEEIKKQKKGRYQKVPLEIPGKEMPFGLNKSGRL
jgi:hypothetical protein